ncbi:MAG: hypothetical protein H7335_01280 [Massilia sp.]|nr:hypothetical protein [Massilia sp.]
MRRQQVLQRDVNALLAPLEAATAPGVVSTIVRGPGRFSDMVCPFIRRCRDNIAPATWRWR